jgi:hypothetical protein
MMRQLRHGESTHPDVLLMAIPNHLDISPGLIAHQ